MVCRVPHNEVVQLVNDALSGRIQDLDQLKADVVADVIQVQEIEAAMEAKLALLPKSSELAEDTGATLIGTSEGINLQAKLDANDTALASKASATEVSTVKNVVNTHTQQIETLNSGVSQLNIEVSSLDAEMDTKAPLNSPVLTGSPRAPTAIAGDNSTLIATTAFVVAALAGLVDSAPGALDTLNELAAALGDDPNFAATMTNALALKAPLDSPNLTGTPTAPTAPVGTSSTQLANTAFVAALGALKANLASPTFTGTPAAPTASAGTNTTQIATTAFVAALGALKANIASPTFTGTPAAPTAAVGTNSTQLATTAFVASALAALVDSAPGTLDTLNELAAALGDDPNFATTMTTALAGKAKIGVNSDITQLTGLTAASPLPGIKDGSTVTAGNVGEVISNIGVATTIASASGNNLASITLTPGYWEVFGAVRFTPTGQTNNWSQMHTSISTVSGTSAGFPYMNIVRSVLNANGEQQLNCPPRRFKVTANTIVYCEGGATFADGTMTCQGFIDAIRII